MLYFMIFRLEPKYKERRNEFEDFMTVGKFEFEPFSKPCLISQLYPK